MGKSVAIVGAGARSLPHFWPSSDEIWGVKYASVALIQAGYKLTRSYWMDNVNTLMKIWDDGTAELVENWPHSPCRLVLTNWPQDEPDPIKYPHIYIFDIKEFVAKFNSDYINNSAAMAICDAILAGYTQIDLHGIDFNPEPARLTTQRTKELIKQAACIAYWIGRGEGMGIKFRINPLSPLLDTFFKTTRGFRILGFPLKLIRSLKTTNTVNFDEAHKNFDLERTDKLNPISEDGALKRPVYIAQENKNQAPQIGWSPQDIEEFNSLSIIKGMDNNGTVGLKPAPFPSK